MRGRAGLYAFGLRGDHAGGNEVIGSESDFAAQPPEPTAEGEAGDSGRGINSGGSGESVRLSRAVHIEQSCSGLNANPAGGRINPDFLHGGKVNHQTAITDRMAG